MLKRLCLVCLFLGYSVSAQFYPYNSRMESLAGTFIVDDMTDVLRYAAYMKNYPNDLQVTFTSPIIGVKALNENFRLGVIGNRGLMLSQQFATNFYSIAVPFVDSAIVAAPNISISNQWIPHVLLGVDAGILTLGFDLFLEYARSRFKQENPQEHTKAYASIHNPGFLASALFGDNFQFAAKFGLAVPMISGKQESDSRTTEVESDKGVYLEFGGEATIPVSSVKVSLGADLIMEKYAFIWDDTITQGSRSADTTDEFSNSRIAIYAGIEGKIFTNGLWAAQYTLNLTGNTSENDGADLRIRASRIVHTFSGCIENGWENLWIFDKVYARGGMRLNLETPLSSEELGQTETHTKNQTYFNQLVPTVGIGICKGVFTLDLNINLGQWDNLVTGPQVSRVTAGLMF